jgi:hypothetical protein
MICWFDACPSALGGAGFVDFCTVLPVPGWFRLSRQKGRDRPFIYFASAGQAAQPPDYAYQSQITDHWLQITDYRSLITDHWSQITDHRSPVTTSPPSHFPLTYSPSSNNRHNNVDLRICWFDDLRIWRFDDLIPNRRSSSRDLRPFEWFDNCSPTMPQDKIWWFVDLMRVRPP